MAMYWPIAGTSLPTPWSGGMPFRSRCDFKVSALVIGNNDCIKNNFIKCCIKGAYGPEQPRPKTARKFQEQFVRVNDKRCKLKMYDAPRLLDINSKCDLDFAKNLRENVVCLVGVYNLEVEESFETTIDSIRKWSSFLQSVNGDGLILPILIGTWNGPRPKMIKVYEMNIKEKACILGARTIETSTAPESDISFINWTIISDANNLLKRHRECTDRRNIAESDCSKDYLIRNIVPADKRNFLKKLVLWAKERMGQYAILR